MADRFKQAHHIQPFVRSTPQCPIVEVVAVNINRGLHSWGWINFQGVKLIKPPRGWFYRPKGKA